MTVLQAKNMTEERFNQWIAVSGVTLSLDLLMIDLITIPILYLAAKKLKTFINTKKVL
jgi:hypothetical protein